MLPKPSAQRAHAVSDSIQGPQRHLPTPTAPVVTTVAIFLPDLTSACQPSEARKGGGARGGTALDLAEHQRVDQLRRLERIEDIADRLMQVPKIIHS